MLYEVITVAGPGFIKEDFAKRLKAIQPNRVGSYNFV